MLRNAEKRQCKQSLWKASYLTDTWDNLTGAQENKDPVGRVKALKAESLASATDMSIG